VAQNIIVIKSRIVITSYPTTTSTITII